MAHAYRIHIWGRTAKEISLITTQIRINSTHMLDGSQKKRGAFGTSFSFTFFIPLVFQDHKFLIDSSVSFINYNQVKTVLDCSGYIQTCTTAHCL